MHEAKAEAYGFTLVEVMVASSILGLTVAAVAAMISNSSLIRSANDHNRQARIIAQTVLEQPAYHYTSYATVLPFVSAIKLDTAGDPATAGATYSVAVNPNTVFQLGLPVNYKQLTSTISWSESGRGKNLILKKRITSLP